MKHLRSHAWTRLSYSIEIFKQICEQISFPLSMIQSHRVDGLIRNSLTMSMIIYTKKRLYVEHRHRTDSDIYTIVNYPLSSISPTITTMYFLFWKWTTYSNRFDSMFLCSRRIDIEPTLLVLPPPPPFFHHRSRRHSSKNSLNLPRYRAEDIDAPFNPLQSNNGINGANVDYIGL